MTRNRSRTGGFAVLVLAAVAMLVSPGLPGAAATEETPLDQHHFGRINLRGCPIGWEYWVDDPGAPGKITMSLGKFGNACPVGNAKISLYGMDDGGDGGDMVLLPGAGCGRTRGRMVMPGGSFEFECETRRGFVAGATYVARYDVVLDPRSNGYPSTLPVHVDAISPNENDGATQTESCVRGTDDLIRCSVEVPFVALG